MRFHNHIGYHDYEGPAVDKAEQERLVQDLGEHNALILKNHGLLTCGPTPGEAFNLIYQLEQACRAQVDVMAAGASIVTPDEDTLAHTAKLYQPGVRRPYGVLEWPAMLRLLQHDQGTWPRYDS
jgi:ribulose-5-phosphate 4-epimerase/fuculose-1-phosphate aldolase